MPIILKMSSRELKQASPTEAKTTMHGTPPRGDRLAEEIRQGLNSKKSVQPPQRRGGSRKQWGVESLRRGRNRRRGAAEPSTYRRGGGEEGGAGVGRESE